MVDSLLATSRSSTAMADPLELQARFDLPDDYDSQVAAQVFGAFGNADAVDAAHEP